LTGIDGLDSPLSFGLAEFLNPLRVHIARQINFDVHHELHVMSPQI